MHHEAGPRLRSIRGGGRGRRHSPTPPLSAPSRAPAAELVWLRAGDLLRSIRLACGADLPDFADLMRDELGWTVPSGVLRAWENGRPEPPPEALARRGPSPPPGSSASRRTETGRG